MAERLNKYLANIGPKLAEKIPENIINFESYLEKNNADSIS